MDAALYATEVSIAHAAAAVVAICDVPEVREYVPDMRVAEPGDTPNDPVDMTVTPVPKPIVVPANIEKL